MFGKTTLKKPTVQSATYGKGTNMSHRQRHEKQNTWTTKGKEQEEKHTHNTNLMCFFFSEFSMPTILKVYIRLSCCQQFLIPVICW